ncbi:conserved domain protein [Bacteroides ovatus SD CMC 3f]|nr:conserved domain protein [Bacteroides ovatus SD CMC 3f]
MNGNGEIEPEEWIKQCPCFEVAKEFNEFGAFADRTDETGSTEKHRVTQHIKEQKGGK